MQEYICYGLACTIASYCSVWLFRGPARKLGLVDIPNHRSSHQSPTIKGGGVVFASIYLLMNLFLYIKFPIMKPAEATILIICPLFLTIGWLDDRFNLSASLRLMIHLLLSAAILFLLTKGLSQSIQMLWLPPLLWLNLLFGILYLTWFTNLYNFMDGVDGMAALTGVVGGFSLFILCLSYGASELATIYLVLGASLLGFLPWNWSPASLFMGESGSYFLGISFAALSLVGKVLFGIPLYPTILLFGLFITDTTGTLIVRVSRGKNPLQAHRQFAFHKLVDKGWSHAKVSSFYGLVCLLWLFPMAYWSLHSPTSAFWIVVVGYFPLICYVVVMRAGRD